MAISLTQLVDMKVKGIVERGDYSPLVSAGAVDILEKIKTYKQEDLNKFIKEVNIHDDSSPLWTDYNSAAIYAWEIMGVKRAVGISTNAENETLPTKWKTADRLGSGDKNNYTDANSLSLVTSAYPGYIVESHIDVATDGDNDNFLAKENANYRVTVFPQVKDFYHSWKIQYIPILLNEYTEVNDSLDGFHSSYIPALAVYVAKNLVLNEMNRLLLLEEDMELAGELKNHYALLEQEYAGLMNIPPKKEAK
tara:strand:+ start:27 stop:779 length:753 start_codon:yes stop_codon:yes gene_type:complete